MPGACVSLWQTDKGAWSAEYFWHWFDYVERGIFLGLALMLACIRFVLIRFLRRRLAFSLECRKFPLESSPDFLMRKRMLVAGRSRGLWVLKGIGSAAPFLGLAGTTYLIPHELFRGFSMSRSSALYYLTNGTTSTLISAAAGIFVAIPAVVIHNVLRTRVETMQRELSAAFANPIQRTFPRAQTLPLKRQFASLPPFALIAAPVVACTVAVFVAAPSDITTGLEVHLPLFPATARQMTESSVCRSPRTAICSSIWKRLV